MRAIPAIPGTSAVWSAKSSWNICRKITRRACRATGENCKAFRSRRINSPNQTCRQSRFRGADSHEGSGISPHQLISLMPNAARRGKYALDLVCRQFVHELQKNGVCPSEADDIVPITLRKFNVGRVCNHVVLLADVRVALEVDQDHGKKSDGNAISFYVIPVASQAFDSQQLNGSPSEWIVPLHSAIVRAHRQAPFILEAR